MPELMPARHLSLIIVLQAAVYWGMVLADPGAMHNHEILEPAAVAHEFNRSAIAWSALPEYLNGEISTWETLELAGWFRLLGLHYPVTLFMAWLPALLAVLLWHRFLAEQIGARAALLGALLISCAPPGYLLLTTQIDSRHIAGNVFIPLLLLLGARLRTDTRLPACLLFAGLVVFGGTITRTVHVFLLACIPVWLARGAPAARRLAVSFILAATCQYLFPPGGPGMLASSEKGRTILRLFLDHWDPYASLHSFTNLLFVSWPKSFGFPSAAGAALLSVAAVSALLLAVTRNRHRGTRLVLAVLCPYLLGYLAVLVLCRLDDGFTNPLAPAWWIYRYLQSLTPCCLVLIGLGLARLPAAVQRLAVLALLLATVATLPGQAHFRFRPLHHYAPVNYFLLGGEIGRQATAENAPGWREQILRFDARYRQPLLAGLAAAAVSPDYPPTLFPRVLALVPETGVPHFLRAAGYWAVPAPALRQHIAALSAEQRRYYAEGEALAARFGDPHRQAWPEYTGSPLLPGLNQ